MKVILLTLDAVRKDIFESEANNLMDFSKDAVYFKNAKASGPRTPYSFPAILSSSFLLMYDDFKCLSYWNECKRDYRKFSTCRFLASEFFSSNKFSTFGFNTNIYTSRFFGYDRGYTKFFDLIDKSSMKKMESVAERKKPFWFRIAKSLAESLPTSIYDVVKDFYETVFVPPTLPYVKVDDLINKVIFKIDTTKSDLFLWFHVMDTHDPRIPPPKFLEKPMSKSEMIYVNKKLIRFVGGKYKGDPPEDLVKKGFEIYKASIRYTDHVLSKFIDYVSSLDDVVLVITADHGEAFMENGMLYHGGLFSDKDSERIWRNFDKELLNIPLIYYNGKKRGVKDKLVSHVDILPTMVREVGLEVPQSWMGEDLFSTKERDVVFSEAYIQGNRFISGISDSAKLIYNLDDNKYVGFLDGNESNIITDINEYSKLRRLVDKIEHHRKIKVEYMKSCYMKSMKKKILLLKKRLKPK